MTDKAYIVVNEQQESEVLDKLERDGFKWLGGVKPTEFRPSKGNIGLFPYVIFVGYGITWNILTNIISKEIVFDGRKEEQMSDKLDRTLTVFTNNGQTFMFKHVTDFKYTTTGFEFSYTGKTTGVERHAVFNNTSVAGYALAD